MGISSISLFENNKNIDDLTVYLIGENISNENKNILEKIGETYERKIIVIDKPKFDIPESLVSARWPRSAFTRLFAGQILPNKVKKILYLDCDTIIKESISALSHIDTCESIFLGVKDCIGRAYKKNIGLDRNSLYVNAGVLLIDLDKLRKIDIQNEIDKYMAVYAKLINYADQDLLNGIFRGKIGTLAAEYDVMTLSATHKYKEIQILRRPTNYYSEEEILASVTNPIVIHYTTNMRVIRPWFKDSNHPFVDVFNYYRSLSPWRDTELPIMKFDSKESKAVSIIQKLPTPLAYRILGILHSEVKPRSVRLRA